MPKWSVNCWLSSQHHHSYFFLVMDKNNHYFCYFTKNRLKISRKHYVVHTVFYNSAYTHTRCSFIVISILFSLFRYFPYEDESNHKLLREIGNVTKGVEITFQFSVKPEFTEGKACFQVNFGMLLSVYVTLWGPSSRLTLWGLQSVLLASVRSDQIE